VVVSCRADFVITRIQVDVYLAAADEGLVCARLRTGVAGRTHNAGDKQ
jgi:hypothetical protein